MRLTSRTRCQSDSEEPRSGPDLDDPGVVHQPVESAEPLHRPIDHHFPPIRIGDVHMLEMS